MQNHAPAQVFLKTRRGKEKRGILRNVSLGCILIEVLPSRFLRMPEFGHPATNAPLIAFAAVGQRMDSVHPGSREIPFSKRSFEALGAC
jgi:hypothetical protein